MPSVQATLKAPSHNNGLHRRGQANQTWLASPRAEQRCTASWRARSAARRRRACSPRRGLPRRRCPPSTPRASSWCSPRWQPTMRRCGGPCATCGAPRQRPAPVTCATASWPTLALARRPGLAPRASARRPRRPSGWAAWGQRPLPTTCALCLAGAAHWVTLGMPAGCAPSACDSCAPASPCRAERLAPAVKAYISRARVDATLVCCPASCPAPPSHPAWPLMQVRAFGAVAGAAGQERPHALRNRALAAGGGGASCDGGAEWPGTH